MTFQLKKATRFKSKLRIGVFGPSGSGKTYSSLLMAYGMADDWDKIALIDTEHGSGDLYSHLGPYNTLTLEPPYQPERYVEAIQACVQAGMQVIIVDSISHEWEGQGGILEIHSLMPGNSFANWSKLTPRHNRFIDAILQSPTHMICCGRAKQDYVLSEQSKGGRTQQVPEKVGLKAVTRDGFDYEMTTAFDLNIHHWATASKDRTGLFMGKPEMIINEETGLQFTEWMNQGADAPTPINARKTAMVRELGEIIKETGLSEYDIQNITGLPTFKGISDEDFSDGLQRLRAYIAENLIQTSEATA